MISADAELEVIELHEDNDENEGGSANECLKFRSPTFDIMTPSRGEHVGMCVREYAELTKDPSACELLMPSSYGLDCGGGGLKVNQISAVWVMER